MAVGQIVFPTVIVGFLIFLNGLLVSTPATPAPEDPESRYQRVKPGDQVAIEVTGYHGDGFVFFSTMEERRGTFKIGAVPPIFQESPVSYRLDEVPAEEMEGLDAELVGRRVHAPFTTNPLPPEHAFGAWEKEVDLGRLLPAFPFVVRYDETTQFGGGETFNVSQFLSFWSGRGYELSVDALFPCEGPKVWKCRVVELSRESNAFAYRRETAFGATYPLLDLFGELPSAGRLDWNVTVVEAAGPAEFQLRLDPPVGTRFQIRQNVPALFEAGTYEVVSLTPSTLHMRVSSVTGSNPLLVGETVYYDLEIVQIVDAAT